MELEGYNQEGVELHMFKGGGMGWWILRESLCILVKVTTTKFKV